MVRKQNGFTLVEVIVVAGIIAILAGILVPLILKEIDESRITRAAADIRSVSNAVIIFKKDTARWPNLDGACNPAVTLLFGYGNLPGNIDAKGFSQATNAFMNDYFSADGTGCYGAKFKGPYLGSVSPDPWGNSYIINADGFSGAGAVWILSGGPDGMIDTSTEDTVLQGDDVGLRIK